MKKNDQALIDLFIENIEGGAGRVAACKSVRLHYDTFLDWLNPESPRYSMEFSERLKKAENAGRQRLKEVCENVIIKAATDKNKPVWQAAAWMLERKFPKEYGIKHEMDLGEETIKAILVNERGKRI
jgi:hypothetical protein